MEICGFSRRANWIEVLTIKMPKRHLRTIYLSYVSCTIGPCGMVSFPHLVSLIIGSDGILPEIHSIKLHVRCSSTRCLATH